jgi:putative RNA 2'-phosphotransferase
MNTDYIEISKFIAYHLRHNSKVIDNHGWCDINWLVNSINIEYPNLMPNPFTVDDLVFIVTNDNKQRYAFNEDMTHVRAVQGHSVPVDLELIPAIPPDILFHGTARRNQESILQEGIQKMSRQYVHLSSNIDTAYTVGKRYGIPLIFGIRAYQMYKDGYKFYKSENGVWLTDEVPSKYLFLL